MPSKSVCAFACPLTPLRLGTDAATDLARDVVLVAIGFGVLGFQRAQVRRRALADAVRQSRQLFRPDAA